MKNRLIKFRAWYQGKMHYNIEKHHIEHHSLSGWSGDVWDFSDWLKYAEVQQFTGFKDINGKEIYEGDVCSYIPPSSFSMYSGQNDVEVFYETDRGQYMCKSKKGNFRWMLSHSFTTQSLMVIGNKSQNPELLK